jgi:uncharacterized protein (TIGR03086 family)
MDTAELHRRTTLGWVDRVAEVPADAWSRPTPCSDWNVRELVNHVVGEDRWTPPLMDGQTIADVGTSLDGDLLGEDPPAAARAAAGAAVDAVERILPLDRPVHLSYGDESPQEYVLQLAADHLIHGWDLAAAVGGTTELDPDLVDAVTEWFAEREELYRAAGVTGARADGTGGGAQAELLRAFGRDPGWLAG